MTIRHEQKTTLVSFFKHCALSSVLGLILASCQTSQNQEVVSSEWASFEDAQAQTFIEDCQQAYKKSESIFAELSSGTYAGAELLEQMNDLSLVIDGAFGKASLYANVHPNGEIQKAAEFCDQKFVSLSTEIGLSQGLYQQVNKLDMSAFEATEQRLIEDTLLAFTRSGVNLNETDRLKVKALNEEINELGQAFYKNTRDDVRSLEVSLERDLSGLPQDFIDARLNEEKTSLTLTTNYPDYFPVMQYAHNDELRKEMYTLFRSRGYPANEPVLDKILQKRYELAKLLGYKNYADYVTEPQMIESAEKAHDFINAIAKTAMKKAQGEYQELLAELQKTDPSATSVGDWQKTYLSEKLKQQKFAIDSQKVREYFQYEAVKNGIFALTEHLFGVQIKAWETETWHESVEAFQIVENEKVLGQF